LMERTHLSVGLLRAIDYHSQLPVFSTARIWMAAVLHLLKLRDCRYILPALQAYQHHEKIARESGSG
jgi:hypothetical protein